MLYAKPSNGYHKHTLMDGTNAEGILHFYFEAGKLVTVSEQDYLRDLSLLPDVCFAIKYPIINMESKDWPDLSYLLKHLN